ncbi:uncharacterized protein METZ01_LOCUS200095 [marine metagenome]|uniref:Uncharacterized protein n=1 Tax=marine metagenome TaxID=408172 RepID=A0A382EB92_9ZZZZ
MVPGLAATRRLHLDSEAVEIQVDGIPLLANLIVADHSKGLADEPLAIYAAVAVLNQVSRGPPLELRQITRHRSDHLRRAACAYLHLGAPVSLHPPQGVQEFRCSSAYEAHWFPEVLYAPRDSNPEPAD